MNIISLNACDWMVVVVVDAPEGCLCSVSLGARLFSLVRVCASNIWPNISLLLSSSRQLLLSVPCRAHVGKVPRIRNQTFPLLGKASKNSFGPLRRAGVIHFSTNLIVLSMLFLSLSLSPPPPAQHHSINLIRLGEQSF